MGRLTATLRKFGIIVSSVLILGSFMYAALRASSVTQVHLTHIGPPAEPRDLLGGKEPDYSVRINYGEMHEQSVVVENQSAKTPLTLSLRGEYPAEWITSIEVLEHDGPLHKQVALVQPLPPNGKELDVSGYRVRWEQALSKDAALNALWYTPVGIVLIVLICLLVVSSVLYLVFESA